jgi:hypothetical protein
MTFEDERYEQWVERRRADQAAPELTDRVMAAIARSEDSGRASSLLLLLMWVDRSWVRRIAACAAAFMVGSIPFAYIAYISKALPF